MRNEGKYAKVIEIKHLYERVSMQRRHSRNQISKVEEQERERTKMKMLREKTANNGSNLRIHLFPMKMEQNTTNSSQAHVRKTILSCRRFETKLKWPDLIRISFKISILEFQKLKSESFRHLDRCEQVTNEINIKLDRCFPQPRDCSRRQGCVSEFHIHPTWRLCSKAVEIDFQIYKEAVNISCMAFSWKKKKVSEFPVQLINRWICIRKHTHKMTCREHWRLFKI